MVRINRLAEEIKEVSFVVGLVWFAETGFQGFCVCLAALEFTL